MANCPRAPGLSSGSGTIYCPMVLEGEKYSQTVVWGLGCGRPAGPEPPSGPNLRSWWPPNQLITRSPAGRAIVIVWYGAMGEVLGAGNEDVVFRLFEAALSVPIRLRLCPDEDTCHVISLLFSENLYASSAAVGAESFWICCEKVGMLIGVRKA